MSETKDQPSKAQGISTAQIFNLLLGLVLFVFWILLIVRTLNLGKSKLSHTHKQAVQYNWGIALCVLVVFLPIALNAIVMGFWKSDDDAVRTTTISFWSNLVLNIILLAVVIFLWRNMGAQKRPDVLSDASMYNRERGFWQEEDLRQRQAAK